MTTSAAPTRPIEQCFQLDFVDWELYEYMLNRLADRHVFLTFHDGSIELMSPSFKHDKRGRYLGILVSEVALHLGMSFQGAGTTTFKRKDMQSGLEPDECFYIKNVESVRDKDEIDLIVDPPPDLAIEVEVSRRMLDRIPIYAALGVPEIWRDDGKKIHVHVLGKDGRYQEVSQSLSFPTLPMDQVNRLIESMKPSDEAQWIVLVRKWVKQNLVGKS